MIKKGEINNCIALDDFNLSRVASDRGYNHAFVWYDEVTYGPYFQAPVLDWFIIKQNDRQCMLLFCDRIIYCLCKVLPSPCFFYMGEFFVMEYLIQ